MPEPTLSPATEFLVYLCVGLSIVFAILNSKTASLKIAVLNRWARWLGVSLGAAFLFFDAGWLERPFWVIAAMFFLGWLLLETLYTWFAIKALSQSSLALFPRFSENATGEEWPAQKRLIEIKDWLRAKGFSRVKALVADVGHGIKVRSTVFQSEDAKTRFQILFIPQGNGDIGFCFSFSSETEEERFITDNLYMPYGGFYPQNWNVARKPWCRSPQRLFKAHQKRVEKAAAALVPYEVDPVDELNHQQRILEKTNIEAGFLMPLDMQEEYGRITWEGRYRVWKEVWLLNYLGISTAS